MAGGVFTKMKNVASQENKPHLGIAATVITVVAVVLLVGVVANRFSAGSNPTMAQGLGISKESLPAWLNADAMQCQGDMSKLSPSEQQKIAEAYHNGASTVVKASYSLQTQ